MKKSLDEALCRDFPLTFADRHASMRTTCMCWGFDVGDGWEPLIRRCAEKIEKEIAKQPLEIQGEFKTSQVKEKFGTLRFYMTAETEAMTAAIQEAEDESAHTCEECGGEGALQTGSWLRTLCDDCLV